MPHITLLLILLAFLLPATAHALPESLLKAYPNHLAAIDGDTLVWKDGTRMPITPEFEAMFATPYPTGRP
ncbi:MAG: hypothetical protein K2Q01_02725, partial [Rickettsiales bacterium]|nr:hypothetical protein [Rickettsiales bacterium]